MDLLAVIKKIQETTINPQERIVSDGLKNYSVDNEGRFEILSSAIQEPLELTTLTGLVDYINSEIDLGQNSYLLQIENEHRVALKTPLINGRRQTLARAVADVPEIDLNYFMEVEKMNIMLQSSFAATEDRDLILKVIGNIREESVKNTGDDGISQQVRINQGVSTVTDVRVPNPVVLAPYRTFSEVYQQPSSNFIFRMKEGPKGALFEADGGAWRNTAISRVALFLETELKEAIEKKKIILIA